MPTQRPRRRTVLFLGAGASRPFGYPLSAEILPAIWEGLHRKSGPGSWTRWAGMRGRPGDARLLKRLLEAMLPGLQPGTTLDGSTSILDVISLVDQVSVEGRSPTPALSSREVLEAQRVL